METRTTTLRCALLAAAGIVIVCLFWDSDYHARNPGPGAGLEMLESHGVTWTGLLAATGVSALALARRTERRRAFSFAFGGALAGVPRPRPRRLRARHRVECGARAPRLHHR